MLLLSLSGICKHRRHLVGLDWPTPAYISSSASQRPPPCHSLHSSGCRMQEKEGDVVSQYLHLARLKNSPHQLLNHHINLTSRLGCQPKRITECFMLQQSPCSSEISGRFISLVRHARSCGYPCSNFGRRVESSLTYIEVENLCIYLKVFPLIVCSVLYGQ